MKKIALLLALMMALSGMIFACAEEMPESYTSGDFEYCLLEDGTASITYYLGEAQTLEIPAQLDGHSVTAIGEFAFSGFESLSAVVIPDGVTTIGASAFSDCASLGSITIPDSVVSLSANPFLNCAGLTQFRLSPNHPVLEIVDGVLFDKTNRELICYPGGLGAESYAVPQGTLSIGDWAFSSCQALSAVSIPDSVTTIGEAAFYTCYSLTDVSIAEGVTSIDISAFAGCEALREISIPESVTAIGDLAFSYCVSLEEIFVPKAVTTISESAFSNCASLKTATLAEGVTTIGEAAFAHCDVLSEIIIPESVTVIGDRAFVGCEALSTISIPDSVVSVGVNPFAGCTKLTEIRVSPEHPVLALVDGVLFDQTEKRLICYPCAFAAESYVVPEGTLVIGERAFYICSLRDIALPESLTAIDTSAFAGCEALNAITIPENVTSIGMRAFYKCGSELVLTVERDSCAEKYARENEIACAYPDANG